MDEQLTEIGLVEEGNGLNIALCGLKVDWEWTEGRGVVEFDVGVKE